MRPSTDPRPLVAVAADVKEINGFAWHAVIQTYLAALIQGSGAIPMIVPSLGDMLDIDALLDRVDGVLLPGSRSNVHPSEYGELPSERAEPHDRHRDAATLPLIRATLRHGVPLFAICRGMQELNVALGGTLVPEVHELPGRFDHRAQAGDDDQNLRYAIRQDVEVLPGGTLAGILGVGTIRVNSLHRQAIGRLAEGLAVEATAADGTIEAVRVRDAANFALGVQWHPEYWVRTDPPSERLFAAFGAALRMRLAARSEFDDAAE
jgi:putative glutamine amidotransferase